MKQDWDRLTFPELYVAAIRLYDLGYRKEAVYWFYSAQYRGRQFGVLLDQTKMGSIGSPGFELLHAQNAFYQLVGPLHQWLRLLRHRWGCEDRGKGPERRPPHTGFARRLSRRHIQKPE